MSGIEMDPEDVGLPSRVPGNLTDEFLRRAKRSGAANGMSEADLSQLAGLIHDYKNRGADNPEYEVVESFISKHGMTLFMAVASATLSALLSAGGVWLGIRDELATQRGDIATIQRDFKAFVEDRDKYRGKYVPLVEDNREANQRQDANIQSLRDSILQLRNTVETQAKSVNETHEDVAVLKNIITRQAFPPRN